MNAEVKEMPEITVAYVRKVGPYGKETCEAAFGELMQWAGPRGLIGQGPVLSLYWDDPETTPPEECRTDVCIAVPEGTAIDGPVALQSISGGQHAVCSFEIAMDEFGKAWEEAFTWFGRSGHLWDNRPCYELYHNNPEEHPEGKCIVDICIPLKAE